MCCIYEETNFKPSTQKRLYTSHSGAMLTYRWGQLTSTKRKIRVSQPGPDEKKNFFACPIKKKKNLTSNKKNIHRRVQISSELFYKRR